MALEEGWNGTSSDSEAAHSESSAEQGTSRRQKLYVFAVLLLASRETKEEK